METLTITGIEDYNITPRLGMPTGFKSRVIIDGLGETNKDRLLRLKISPELGAWDDDREYLLLFYKGNSRIVDAPIIDLHSAHHISKKERISAELPEGWLILA